MANLLLKPGERVRNVWRIIWMEQMESVCPENPYGHLLAYLASLKVPCCVSPVHDKDTYDEHDVRNWLRRHGFDPSTGKPGKKCPDPYAIQRCPKVGDAKKPHVHVLFAFSGPQTADSLTEMFSDYVWLNPNAWEKVLSLPSAIRYLAHLDSEEQNKHKYSALSVVGFGGMDLSALLRENSMSKFLVYMTVQNYVMDNKISHYYDLVNWAVTTGDMETIACVKGNVTHFCHYFHSKSDKRKLEEERRRREEKNEE